ncbi:L-threonine 3-dehydrogenase [Priestia flexa]|jgi:threonine 3-dehydrogenase|uniref:L-threonine 3-dehydrogenase n=1 Tax=Priestia flexa TaxID=86664 RepID=A0A1N6NV92_9BACI|nr:L-threonine 3-dehydrogenase [Priestia flexa]MBN8250006.1 L-threonine 3-dehydrogenase [Priestia flexa]MBY6084712.1 L-threonine 3-dehydrogenase [Priestia flexa]SIP95960.1 L-threonine 3-dehydrogenase [Priestia flexa]
MGGKMKALVKDKRGFGAVLAEVDIPSIADDEVLIKVKATSICGTDVHIYKWDKWASSRVNPPYVFGHEFSGEVVQVGQNVAGVQIGDSVSAETHIVCGRCMQCLLGNAHICQKTKIIGVDRMGCFAEYVAVPAQNIWKNPNHLSHDVACLQEPLGNAVHTVLNDSIAGKSVLVIGCGPIGLMAVAVAKASGASLVIAMDVNEYRLSLAKDLGTHIVLNPLEQDPLEVINKLTSGNGIDVVCEMSGQPTAMNQGFKMVANGGRVSILSLPTAPVSIDVTNDIVFKGVTVQGITGRKMFSTWYTVSNLLAGNQLNMNELITHRLPLEDYEKGFELMMEGKCGKVVFILE